MLNRISLAGRPARANDTGVEAFTDDEDAVASRMVNEIKEAVCEASAANKKSDSAKSKKVKADRRVT